MIAQETRPEINPSELDEVCRMMVEGPLRNVPMTVPVLEQGCSADHDRSDDVHRRSSTAKGPEMGETHRPRETRRDRGQNESDDLHARCTRMPEFGGGAIVHPCMVAERRPQQRRRRRS
jgi:hypothetical protein